MLLDVLGENDPADPEQLLVVLLLLGEEVGADLLQGHEVGEQTHELDLRVLGCLFLNGLVVPGGEALTELLLLELRLGAVVLS